MNINAVKTFKVRSSATDVLRAIGVPTRDYNLFIEPVANGVECKIGLAQSHVENLKKQTGKTDDANLKTSRDAKIDPVGAKVDNAVSHIVKTLVGVSETAATAAVEEAASLVVGKIHAEPMVSTSNFPRAPKINKKPVKAKTKNVAKAATKPAQKDKRTVSSVARQLIVAGKDNDEVWAALKKEFHLDDTKKSYPAWYRRECKAKGLIK